MKIRCFALFLLPSLIHARVGDTRFTPSSSCDDLLEEKFYFATQIKVGNVLCQDTVELSDLILDHLAMPKTFSDEVHADEMDVCRTFPIPGEPCPGYLEERNHDHQSKFEWTWRGTGSCGIFKVRADCDPLQAKNTKIVRRMHDIQRLSMNEAEDLKELPDFASKRWLKDGQREKLNELVVARQILISRHQEEERHLNETIQLHREQEQSSESSQTLAKQQQHLDEMTESHRGKEKQVLGDTLDLFARFEAEQDSMTLQLTNFEKHLTDMLQGVLDKTLYGSCFLEEKPDIAVAITPMATREHAVAYVQEQC